MPKLVDKTKKAEAIARAALPVFRTLGYHRARMADVAEAAGVGKGTLYEYFPNKSEILCFEFERYFAAFREGALASMARATSPGGRLHALIGFAFDQSEEWEDHCAVYVDCVGSSRSSEKESRLLADIYQQMQSLLATLIAEAQASGEAQPDVEPGAVADLLLSMFDGLVLHGVFDEWRCSRDALRAAAFRLLAGGLFTNPTGSQPVP